MTNAYNEFRAADAIEFVRAMDACQGRPELAREKMKELNARIAIIEKSGVPYKQPIPTYLLAAYRGYEAVLAPPMMIVKVNDALPNQQP